MPRWIQIEFVSDDEDAGQHQDRRVEQETSSTGLGRLFAVGAGLVLLGTVLFVGWYFGFRTPDQSVNPAAARGDAVPMPAGQLSGGDAGVTAQQPQNSTAPDSNLGAASGESLILSDESKRRLESDEPAATVNGDPITEAMLEREIGVARVLYSLRQGTAFGNDPQTLERMRSDLLSSIVDERLVMQAALEAGVTVSEGDLDARIDRLLDGFQISEDTLTDKLAAVGLTMEDLRESLRTTMLTEQFVTQNPPPEDVTAKSDYAAWVKVLQREGDIEILASGEVAKIAKVGQPAPNFTLRAPDGEAVSLSDFAGQSILINFWATWCPPCRFEMPLFEQTYQKLKDDGFVVLAVDVQEGPEEVKSYMAEMGLSFPVVLDRSGAVSNTYRVTGLPTSVFVDANGVVTDIHRGAVIESQLQRYLDNIMQP